MVVKSRSALGEMVFETGIFFSNKINIFRRSAVIMERNAVAFFHQFFVFLKLPQNLWPRAEIVIMHIHFGVSACFFQFLLQGEDELGLDVRMPETRRHLALLCSFRLVLRRKRGDRYTALLIFFYKPHQIIGIAVDKLLAHAAAAHGAAGFHPAGWTPRRGKYE